MLKGQAQGCHQDFPCPTVSYFTHLNKAKKSLWEITVMQPQFFLHEEITKTGENFAGEVFRKFSV